MPGTCMKITESCTTTQENRKQNEIEHTVRLEPSAAYLLCSSRNLSASMAAMQPVPAAVMAWR